mmetsp:Transcript_8273/g.10838  ORF Transcript_8273/g.10838 Transcript_8273/m.10838 type:complete len:344 (-) Transcript_8273:33-1064(-)
MIAPRAAALLSGSRSIPSSRFFLPSSSSSSHCRPSRLLIWSVCYHLLHSATTTQAYSTMPSFTERSSDGIITVSPKNEAEQSALVVISHGLGDTAEGFADVAEMLAKEMPYCKFVLPTAPTQPVTMNMGMSMPSWYDIVGLDERSNESCKGIEESRQKLVDILEKEHETTGLPYNRMILAGFSQGAALSLYTGMQMKSADQKLAALVIMSGYLPAASKFTITPGLEPTPILHCHGSQDMMVNPIMAQKSKAAVLAKGALEYTHKTYPIAHTVSEDELADVAAFLKEKLPHDESCRVQLKEPSQMSVKELRAAIRKAGISSKSVGFMEKSEFVKLVADHRSGKL